MRNSVLLLFLLPRHVLRRFEICQKLGKGAYGIVWKAIEKRTRQVWVLKAMGDDAHMTHGGPFPPSTTYPLVTFSLLLSYLYAYLSLR